MPIRRNPYACLPILRKGGVHEKSKSSKRATLKQSLEDEIDEYFKEQEEEGTSFRPTNEGGSETTYNQLIWRCTMYKHKQINDYSFRTNQ